MSARYDDMKIDGLKVARYLKFQAEAKTLGANVTMLNDDGVVQAFDAGGSSRNVTLPTRAAINDGSFRIFHNISTDGENLVIKDAAAATILTIPSGGIGFVIASGTAEAPETRGWAAATVGASDLTIADDLTVTGDLTVTTKAVLGGATSNTVAFYGTTAISQRASSAQASTLGSTTSFGTAGVAALQEVMNTLTALGLWKGGA